MITCPDDYEPYEGLCPHCHSDGFFDYRPNGPHMAVYCTWCGGFIKFAGRMNITKWKKKVKERDQYVCQKCKKVFDSTKLDAHHKIPVWFMEELKFDLDNGITLCKQCHHALHGVGGTIKEKQEDTTL